VRDYPTSSARHGSTQSGAYQAEFKPQRIAVSRDRLEARRICEAAEGADPY
jgi:hypothetical protein